MAELVERFGGGIGRDLVAELVDLGVKNQLEVDSELWRKVEKRVLAWRV